MGSHFKDMMSNLARHNLDDELEAKYRQEYQDPGIDLYEYLGKVDAMSLTEYLLVTYGDEQVLQAIKKVNNTDGTYRRPIPHAMYPREWMAEKATLSVRINAFNKIDEDRKRKDRMHQEALDEALGQKEGNLAKFDEFLQSKKDAYFLKDRLSEMDVEPEMMEAATRIQEFLEGNTKDATLKYREGLDRYKGRLRSLDIGRATRMGREDNIEFARLTKEKENSEKKYKLIRDRWYFCVEAVLNHPDMSVEEAVATEKAAKKMEEKTTEAEEGLKS